MIFVVVSGGEVARDDDDDRTPSISSEAWRTLSGSVLTFLDEPRDWDELDAWIKARSFGATRFRHILAWLEEQRLATTFIRKDPDTEGATKKVYWVSTSWVSRISVRPPRPSVTPPKS